MGDVRHELAVGAVVRLVLLPIGSGNDVRRMSKPVSDHGALLAHRGAALSPVFSDHVCEFGHGASLPEPSDSSRHGCRAAISVPLSTVTVDVAYSHNHPALGVPSEIHQGEGGLEIVVTNNGCARLHQNGLLATDHHGIDVKGAEPRLRKRHGNDERLIGDSNGRLHLCPHIGLSTDRLAVAGRTQENRQAARLNSSH